MKPVPLGIRLRQSFHTTPGDTADALGNAGVGAVSSVALILHVEAACYALVLPYYEPGELTVGTRFALDHIAPAAPGRPVEVVAEVSSVEGRRVGFAVTVVQNGRVVMEGEHQRAFVAAERFANGTVAGESS